MSGKEVGLSSLSANSRRYCVRTSIEIQYSLEWWVRSRKAISMHPLATQLTKHPRYPLRICPRMIDLAEQKASRGIDVGSMWSITVHSSPNRHSMLQPSCRALSASRTTTRLVTELRLPASSRDRYHSRANLAIAYRLAHGNPIRNSVQLQTNTKPSCRFPAENFFAINGRIAFPGDSSRESQQIYLPHYSRQLWKYCLDSPTGGLPRRASKCLASA